MPQKRLFFQQPSGARREVMYYTTAGVRETPPSRLPATFPNGAHR
ncbi:MAG: hypothetical protein WBQ86_13475 [Candidatus Binatus sp.]